MGLVLSVLYVHKSSVHGIESTANERLMKMRGVSALYTMAAAAVVAMARSAPSQDVYPLSRRTL